MKVQKCNKCGKEFRWSKIYKSLWFGYKPIKCEDCKAIYEVPFSTRSWNALLFVVPAVLFGLYSNLNIIIGILITILIAFVITLFFPFFIKYKYKENEI